MLDLFNVCSNHAPLDYNGQNFFFLIAVYDPDIPVTLKQGHDHETWKNCLTQINNHAKFERLPLNSVPQKANIKVFVKSEGTSIISRECMPKVKSSGVFIVYLLTLL